MLQLSLIRSVLPFVIGVVLSGGIVHLFWSNYSLEREKKIAEDWAANLQFVNNQLQESQEAREKQRLEYLEKIGGIEDENKRLESDVSAGRKRLRIATANCVPPSGTDAGGTGEGTAELAPSARQDYYALRSGLEEQFELLQYCRAELKRRSAHGTR